MRKLLFLFLFFIVLSLYVVDCYGTNDDIIIEDVADEESDIDYSEEEIKSFNRNKDKKKEDIPFNPDTYFSWTRNNTKLFVYKIVAFAILFIAAVINGIIGRKKNKQIAISWVRNCRDIFLENFEKVGNEKSVLLEKSYDTFEFFSTGRKNCNFYRLTLNLGKRQCLWRYYLFHYFVQQKDTMHIAINFETLDKHIFCIYRKNQKKEVESMFPNLQRYTKFVEKKDVHSIYEMRADTTEICEVVMGGKILNFLNANPNYINYICITDIPLLDPDEEMNDKKKEPNICNGNYCYINLVMPENVEELRKLIFFSIFMIDACQCIELSERAREKVRNLRSMVEKESYKRKQEIKELQEKQRLEKLKQEKEKLENMTAEQQRKYEERKQKKSLKKNKKMKIIKI